MADDLLHGIKSSSSANPAPAATTDNAAADKPAVSERQTPKPN
jgi:carboxyl-terminal processing protease